MAVHVLVPYSQGELVDEIHRTGVVTSSEFSGEGAELRAHVPLALAQRLQPLRAATAAALERAEAQRAQQTAAEAAGEPDDWDLLLSSIEEEEAAEAAAAAAAGAAKP